MLINVTNIHAEDYIFMYKNHQNPLFSSDLVIQPLTQQIFIEFLHVPDTVLGFRNAVVNK